MIGSSDKDDTYVRQKEELADHLRKIYGISDSYRGITLADYLRQHSYAAYHITDHDIRMLADAGIYWEAPTGTKNL